MSISYKGYCSNTISIPADSLTVGALVTTDSNNKAVAAADGANFIGVCTNFRNKSAGIQTSGYVEAEYTGTAPSRGLARLVSATNGKVKVSSDTSIPLYKILYLDTTDKIVGFIL